MTKRNNLQLLRGLFLTLIAAAFGIASIRYTLGSFSRPGPGLFPFLVSGLLFLIGLILMLRSALTAAIPMNFRVKSIVVLLAAMIGFVAISKYVNMTLGILFLVTCSSWAGTSPSIVRSPKISVALLGVAMAFKYLLRLNLPLL